MTRALFVLALLGVLAGCASSAPPQQHPRSSATPRVRCLTDPNDTTLRPLFFLFCVESP